jgi:hypothetical protein
MENYPKFHNEVGVPIVRIGRGDFAQGPKSANESRLSGM